MKPRVKKTSPSFSNTPLGMNLMHVSQIFSGRHIFSDLSLECNSRDPMLLVGPSGSGKSTFLSLAAGLITPSSWEIIFTLWNHHYRTWDSNFNTFARASLGIFFTEWHFFETHTASENIMFPHLFANYSFQRAMYSELLEVFEMSERILNTSLHSLSSGERERINLVRLFVSEPQILLLDEPFSHLDGRLFDRSMHFLKRYIHSHQALCILATHTPERFPFATRILAFHTESPPTLSPYV